MLLVEFGQTVAAPVIAPGAAGVAGLTVTAKLLKKA